MKHAAVLVVVMILAHRDAAIAVAGKAGSTVLLGSGERPLLT